LDRLTLERRQVWIYLTAIFIGLALGGSIPQAGAAFEKLLWPALMLLLYVTFMQVPLLHLREAFKDCRFVALVLFGNFVVLPAFAWMLVQGLPQDVPLRLGVLLVLLVPCTDWFITFCQLGGGNVPRAIAVTPLNLLLQLILLPAYLWLLLRSEFTVTLGPSQVWPALLVILLPLIGAAGSERWIETRPTPTDLRARLAWWPVPLLGLVVFLIAAAQAQEVRHAAGLLPQLVPIYAAFLLTAAFLAKLLALAFALPGDQARTLAFSLGTRNSFVVLPFALTLPPGWEIAPIAIVLQSLVELLGMLVYLRLMPQIFPR
jgi:ACR3 family arsenite efflux pump ArsB